MSRIASAPIELPTGVEFSCSGEQIRVKGPKGNLEMKLHPRVRVEQDNGTVVVKPAADSDLPLAGTMRALLGNMVSGVTDGFEKRLTLIGVGYRAQMQGKKLSLTLGFSHPVEYQSPEGINIDTPSQTEIVITGCDKQRVGQVAAEIRGFRPPEPYKGKGVRYFNERVVRKEAKKA